MNISQMKENAWHFLLWSIAVLYLVFGPSISHLFFIQEGKPIQIWENPPEMTGGIQHNVEDLKYWVENMQVHEEVETYALWGWAFLDIDRNVRLENFDRFIVLSDSANSYVFPTELFPRPGVQNAFKDLGLTDLSSAGFYSVISRNALSSGRYDVGILFTQKKGGEQYYVLSNRVVVRSPNHLSLEVRVTK